MTPGPLLLLLTSPCPIRGSSSGVVLQQSCEMGISQCRRNTELIRIHIFIFLPLMFKGLYPLVSQDSFTPVSLTFDASLLGNEEVQSSVCRLLNCLASKRRKKQQNCSVWRSFQELLRNHIACRFHCRCREGIEIISAGEWAAFAFGEDPGLLTSGEAGGLWAVVGRDAPSLSKGRGLTQLRLSWSLAEAPNLSALGWWKVLVQLLVTPAVGTLALYFFPSDKWEI